MVDHLQLVERVLLALGRRRLACGAALAVVDPLARLVQRFARAAGVEGARPGVLLAQAALEVDADLVLRQLQAGGEAALAGEMVVQRADAHAGAEAAGAGDAVEGALGRGAPGGTQVLQQVVGDAVQHRQAGMHALLAAEQQVFTQGVDQALWIETLQLRRLLFLQQAGEARRAVGGRGEGEQAAGQAAVLQAGQTAPARQVLAEDEDGLLAQLVAARTAEQQAGQVVLFDGLRRALAGVLQRQALELAAGSGAVELVQLQPETLAGRGV
ncbi:hypothetical protein D3C78_925370 [compost metagenome]